MFVLACRNRTVHRASVLASTRQTSRAKTVSESENSDSREKSFIIFLNPLSLSCLSFNNRRLEKMKKRGLGDGGVSPARILPGRRRGEGRKLGPLARPTITGRRVSTEDQRLKYRIKKGNSQRFDVWKRVMVQRAVRVGLLGSPNLYHLHLWREKNVKGFLRGFPGGVTDL